MKVLVFSHKEVWKSERSPIGWATDGGFVFHMMGVGSLFDEIEVIVPEIPKKSKGEVLFKDECLTITPIQLPHALKGWKRKLFVLFWGLTRIFYLIRKIKAADMVHIPIPSDFGTVGMLLAKWMKKPLFIRYCGNWLVSRTKAEHFWQQFMIKHAGNGVVCFATGGGHEPPAPENKNLKWIFSSSLLESELAELQQKALQKSKSDVFRITSVARQSKGKGTDKTIHAIAELKDQNIQFDVVGDGADLNEFKQLAKDLDVQDKVIFHGKLNNQEVIDILLKSDLFCFPSLSEGFPKAVMEAMACGLPVITNPISVLPLMVGDTNSGVILKENSASEIARALKAFMHSKEKMETCSTNALKAVKQYSIENWADIIAQELSDEFEINIKRKRKLIK
ncbi:MAG: glycosyltransferase family 4 protein [Flammeovirgaceae bacterium]